MIESRAQLRKAGRLNEFGQYIDDAPEVVVKGGGKGGSGATTPPVSGGKRSGQPTGSTPDRKSHKIEQADDDGFEF